MADIRYSERSIKDVAAIYSSKVQKELDSVLQSLEKFPELGSSQVRNSLKAVFESDLRKMPVSNFLIIYRYTEQTVDILALVYGPTVS
jgi:plasmid stabilization system protein ParE